MGNISFQLVAQQCCNCKLLLFVAVLPPPRATNFHVAKSRNIINFLQHENLLRADVVIRATNHRNLQFQH